MLPGRPGHPLQGLLEVHGRTLASVAGELQVVDHRLDDLQTAAVLGGHGHRLVGDGKPAGGWLAVAVAAAGGDDLDRAPAVPGADLDFVLLAGACVLDDVGAGLAERQGDVGASIRRDPERLQAAVENLTPDRHADRIARQVQGDLDLYASHLRQTLTTSRGRLALTITSASIGPFQTAFAGERSWWLPRFLVAVVRQEHVDAGGDQLLAELRGELGAVGGVNQVRVERQ